MTNEMKSYLEEQEKAREASKLVDELFRVINSGRDEKVAETLLLAIQNQHRTLQASFWRIIFTVMQKYGETPETHYDLRNEAAVKACKKLAELDQQSYIPFI